MKAAMKNVTGSIRSALEDGVRDVDLFVFRMRNRPGYHSGFIPSALPGAAIAGATALGALGPVSSLGILGVSALGAIAGAAVAPIVSVAALSTATAVSTALAIVSPSFIIPAALGAIASALVGCLIPFDIGRRGDRKDIAKVCAGTLAGLGLGVALTHVAAANLPQPPELAPKVTPPSTMRTEPQGGGLCKDFKLSEGVSVSTEQDTAGSKAYTLTVSQGCTPK